MLAEQGSFDCAMPSLRERTAPLRMTIEEKMATYEKVNRGRQSGVYFPKPKVFNRSTVSGFFKYSTNAIAAVFFFDEASTMHPCCNAG